MISISIKVFWSSADPEIHLKDGRCLKFSEAPEKNKSRSPSPPFIKWKPLRKPIEKTWDEGEVVETRKGKEDNRVVSYNRSPSPPMPVPPPSVKARASNLPKYMLDGKVAYYICR